MKLDAPFIQEIVDTLGYEEASKQIETEYEEYVKKQISIGLADREKIYNLWKWVLLSILGLVIVAGLTFLIARGIKESDDRVAAEVTSCSNGDEIACTTAIYNCKIDMNGESTTDSSYIANEKRILLLKRAFKLKTGKDIGE